MSKRIPLSKDEEVLGEFSNYQNTITNTLNFLENEAVQSLQGEQLDVCKQALRATREQALAAADRYKDALTLPNNISQGEANDKEVVAAKKAFKEAHSAALNQMDQLGKTEWKVIEPNNTIEFTFHFCDGNNRREITATTLSNGAEPFTHLATFKSTCGTLPLSQKTLSNDFKRLELGIPSTALPPESGVSANR